MLRLVPLEAVWPHMANVVGVEHHFLIRSGDLDIGQIYRETGGPNGPQWLWFLTCLHVLPDDGATQGSERTREEAMTAAAGCWRTWLARAGLREVN